MMTLNKRTCSAILVFSALFSNIYIVEGQMVDYSRRAKRSGQAQQVLPAISQPSSTNEPRLFKEEVAVESRFEEAYDLNKDKRLQGHEVRLMVKDIVSSVEKWGQAQVRSAILASFDHDQNSTIDVQEAAELRALLEQ